MACKVYGQPISGTVKSSDLRFKPTKVRCFHTYVNLSNAVKILLSLLVPLRKNSYRSTGSIIVK